MTPAPTTVSRGLEATRDLGVARDWVEDGFASRGRPSGDSVVFRTFTFEVGLVKFCDCARPERWLIATANLSLAHGPDRPDLRQHPRSHRPRLAPPGE